MHERYGPCDLAAIGQALYGERWQSDLARDLGLTDARRVRYWLSGGRPIPPGVWADLVKLLRARKMTIEQALKHYGGKAETRSNRVG